MFFLFRLPTKVVFDLRDEKGANLWDIMRDSWRRQKAQFVRNNWFWVMGLEWACFACEGHCICVRAYHTIFHVHLFCWFSGCCCLIFSNSTYFTEKIKHQIAVFFQTLRTIVFLLITVLCFSEVTWQYTGRKFSLSSVWFVSIKFCSSTQLQLMFRHYPDEFFPREPYRD